MLALEDREVKILKELQKDGRLSFAELADRVGYSAAQCWRRVRHLEDRGVIRSYSALLDPAALGLAFNAFIQVTLDLHKSDEFEAAIMNRDEVVECYALAGEQDFLLHVMVAAIEAFDYFLRQELIHLPGVERMRTSFALKTIKQSYMAQLG